MKPVAFRYVAPRSLAAALATLRDYGDESKALAGGQSLGPLLNLRLAGPSVLVDLRRVGELHAPPAVNGEFVTMGAMTSQSAAERSAAVAGGCPLLAEALPFVAHRTIRNRGTIGGSLAHADPAAEIPAVAVAARAELVVDNLRGRRVVPAAEFFCGYFTTILEPDDLVSEIRFPRGTFRTGSAWTEFAPRSGDFAIVGVAATVQLGECGDVVSAGVVCSGVADRPWRSAGAESALAKRQATPDLLARAGRAAAEECSPSADLIASADYRRHLVALLTTRALTTAAGRAREA